MEERDGQIWNQTKGNLLVIINRIESWAAARRILEA
jgi:hypothetical protein